MDPRYFVLLPGVPGESGRVGIPRNSIRVSRYCIGVLWSGQQASPWPLASILPGGTIERLYELK